MAPNLLFFKSFKGKRLILKEIKENKKRKKEKPTAYISKSQNSF